MKTLVLGGSWMVPRAGISADQTTLAAGEQHRATTNHPAVEIIPKLAWPNERLPGLVDQWMREVQPDLVLFPLNDVWFNFEAVPMRTIRRKGPPGRLINHLWRKAADIPRIKNSRAIQAGRRRLVDAIHAEPEFTPAEVVASVTAVLRTILRNDESTVIVVVGPGNSPDLEYSEAARARRQARRETVNAGVAAICRELKIDHLGMGHPAISGVPRGKRLGDGIHGDPDSNKKSGAYWTDILRPYVERILAEKHHSAPDPA